MDYKMTGGNSRLTDEFVKRIRLDNIKTSTLVTEVVQAEGMVTVKTNSQNYVVDAVICTVPTQSLTRIKFDPPLPAEQLQAAEQLAYARISKNSVLYRKRFWEADNFSMISDLTSHYYFHSTQNQPGTEGILTSYAIGEKADVLASQSNERRLRIIANDLVDFDNTAPCHAGKIASYAWQRDAFTDGAYALFRPGQWFGIRPVLQRPHGKVLFAGEHLADWQGFMEGAIETGESAADSLLA
jgi:monoamine oxidase